jgi:DNA/RNA-binding domain of Phe-tRNA-synthetase-like protein
MNQRTLFKIDPAIAIAFPEIKVGVALICGVKLTGQHAELEIFKQKIIADVRQRLKQQSLLELPRIQCFRKIYKKFGVDPSSYRPSAEALLRRALDPSKKLYKINSVVDCYNVSSIEFMLPMACYDLDYLVPPVTLRFAENNDQHCPIGQQNADEVPVGELVYADQSSVICRGFNYRDSERTKITLNTKDLLLFVDGCDAVTAGEVKEAVRTAAERIASFNGGSIESVEIHES